MVRLIYSTIVQGTHKGEKVTGNRSQVDDVRRHVEEDDDNKNDCDPRDRQRLTQDVDGRISSGIIECLNDKAISIRRVL
jgi:hypothetical protein